MKKSLKLTKEKPEGYRGEIYRVLKVISTDFGLKYIQDFTRNLVRIPQLFQYKIILEIASEFLKSFPCFELYHYNMPRANFASNLARILRQISFKFRKISHDSGSNLFGISGEITPVFRKWFLQNSERNSKQSERTSLWLQEEFLLDSRRFQKLIFSSLSNDRLEDCGKIFSRSSKNLSRLLSRISQESCGIYLLGSISTKSFPKFLQDSKRFCQNFSSILKKSLQDTSLEHYKKPL